MIPAMARKRKTSQKSSSYYDADATLKQIQTQLTDPEVWHWLWTGARGVRERILQLNFQTLRTLSQRLPLISGIINARTDQILPFCHYATEDGDRGFVFELEASTQKSHEGKEDPAEVMELAKFLEQTGFMFDPLREDDMSDYVSMMVRDIYEIDQIATELQRNRRGEVVAFWAMDGATIARTADNGSFAKGIRYVQRIDDKIYAEFKDTDLLFDYRFKRSDIRYRGYGYSPVEQAIDVITTLLFGYNYVRDQLMKDKVPKGFISVMGDVGKPQLDSIRNYWYSAMSGAGGNWAIPIIPSGKDGVGMDFKMLGQSNRDMEYHKTIMFVSSLVAAVFSIDLMELGIKTDDTTSLIGENSEPRLQYSKSRGLGSMLAFIEQHLNKILRKVTEKYRFKFVGMETEDPSKVADVRTKQVGSWRTIDEIREEDGLKPFKEDWSTIPLHPQAVQIFLEAKGAERQKEMTDQQGGGFGAPQGPGGAEDDDADMWKSRLDKSLAGFRRKTDEIERRLHIVVE
jgi:hypothetical protein